MMGRSRSASIVIAYLMRCHGMSYEHALEHVRACRPCVQPNKYFRQQLRIYERLVFGLSEETPSEQESEKEEGNEESDEAEREEAEEEEAGEEEELRPIMGKETEQQLEGGEMKEEKAEPVKEITRKKSREREDETEKTLQRVIAREKKELEEKADDSSSGSSGEGRESDRQAERRIAEGQKGKRTSTKAIKKAKEKLRNLSLAERELPKCEEVQMVEMGKKREMDEGRERGTVDEQDGGEVARETDREAESSKVVVEGDTLNGGDPLLHGAAIQDAAAA